jgi:hypothetical protein
MRKKEKWENKTMAGGEGGRGGVNEEKYIKM